MNIFVTNSEPNRASDTKINRIPKRSSHEVAVSMLYSLELHAALGVSSKYIAKGISLSSRTEQPLATAAALREVDSACASHDEIEPTVLARTIAKQFLRRLHAIAQSGLVPDRIRVSASVEGGIGITIWRGRSKNYIEFDNCGDIAHFRWDSRGNIHVTELGGNIDDGLFPIILGSTGNESVSGPSTTGATGRPRIS